MMPLPTTTTSHVSCSIRVSWTQKDHGAPAACATKVPYTEEAGAETGPPPPRVMGSTRR